MLIDMWAKLDRPHAVFYDITWTGYCGSDPPSALQNIFDVVRDARDRAVERVQTAASRGETIHGFEVDDAARGYIREKGFGDYFFHRTGHSIGEEVHGTGANMDNLETHDERRIIAGTCFSIEPGVYLPEFGIRSEVNVYVEDRRAIVTGEIQQKTRDDSVTTSTSVAGPSRIVSMSFREHVAVNGPDRKFRLDRPPRLAYAEVWRRSAFTLWSRPRLTSLYSIELATLSALNYR